MPKAPSNSAPAPQEDVIARFDQAAAKLQAARAEIGTVIFGQQNVVDQVLITLIAGGHGLLVGVPGLAKTLLVETIGTVFGLDNRRIQCTPDLMPADILGSDVLEEDASGKRHFRFLEGPVFTQLLLADEINRASPRTQSALLQAMQEKNVTTGGTTRDLPAPFHVLATQNPLEQEGTYPLPEAQLDRFLMQIDVTYPDREAEKRVIIETTGVGSAKVKKAMSPEDLQDAQALVRNLPVGDNVAEALLNLVRSLRPEEDASDAVSAYVTWPPGPRAAQALMLCSRARALLEGRETPSVEDIQALAVPVLQHRMALSYQARADGISLTDLIQDQAARL